MSLSRSLSRFLSSQRWSLLRSSSFCTETQTPSPIKRTYGRNPKPSAPKFPKPTEIPFQAKVANSVHLVGSIGVPVHLQTLPSGIYAVTILVQESEKKESAELCIPIIFQGDLAQIAACHLKESDLVYVTGQLTGDALPRTIEAKSQKTVEDAQIHIQVLANSLNFVQKTCSERESEIVYDQDVIASDRSAEVEENSSDLRLWSDLFDHPTDWWDNRSSNSNPARAAFKHKKSGQRLWINDLTPEWVLSKLDTLSFGPSSVNESKNGAKSLWHDLVGNPVNWWDQREDKLKGSVSPKYPDFKQKGSNKGLWLDAAPNWVLLKLDGLVFCGSNSTTKNDKVCRKWNLLASENVIWCKLFKERWRGDRAAFFAPHDSRSWKDVYIVQDRCDRYGLGLKIIREGCDYYLIHQGEIQRYLGGSGKPKNDSKGEEQREPSEIAESILFFIGDLESACTNAKRVCM